jgi:hypothetical protein
MNTTIVIEISTLEGRVIADDKKAWFKELFEGVVANYLSTILRDKFDIPNTTKVYYKHA